MGFNSAFKGLKSGSLKLLEPSRPVMGLLYRSPFSTYIREMLRNQIS
jgi:hypothetical protein